MVYKIRSPDEEDEQLIRNCKVEKVRDKTTMNFLKLDISAWLVFLPGGTPKRAASFSEVSFQKRGKKSQIKPINMITLKRKLISWKLISYDLLELLPFPLLISSSVWPLVSKISIKHYKESKHQLIPSRMSASLPGLPLFCPTGDFKPAEEILGWCL